MGTFPLNLRFRQVPLVFKAAEEVNEEEVKRLRHYQVSSASVVTCHVVWVKILISFLFSIQK